MIARMMQETSIIIPPKISEPDVTYPPVTDGGKGTTQGRLKL